MATSPYVVMETPPATEMPILWEAIAIQLGKCTEMKRFSRCEVGRLVDGAAACSGRPQTGGLALPRFRRNGVTDASRSVRTLDLLGTDLRQFNLAELVKVDLALASPGSTTVNFRTTDRVRVKMWTEFSYRVNP